MSKTSSNNLHRGAWAVRAHPYEVLPFPAHPHELRAFFCRSLRLCSCSACESYSIDKYQWVCFSLGVLSFRSHAQCTLGAVLVIRNKIFEQTQEMLTIADHISKANGNQLQLLLALSDKKSN